jgi:hypothetical protein
MTSADESNKDLSLRDEDAENVTGGMRKKAHKKAAHQSVAAAPTTAVPVIGGSVDPGAAPAVDPSSGDTVNPDDC